MSSVSLTEEEALAVKEWLKDGFDNATPITDRVIHAVNDLFTFGKHDWIKTQQDCANILYSISIKTEGEIMRLIGARLVYGVHHRGKESRVDISEDTVREIREICDALLEAKVSTQ